VSVPNQAGAQHSQSPVEAENGAVMKVNNTAANKFHRYCVALVKGVTTAATLWVMTVIDLRGSSTRVIR
jgi:hypothetical protein